MEIMATVSSSVEFTGQYADTYARSDGSRLPNKYVSGTRCSSRHRSASGRRCGGLPAAKEKGWFTKSTLPLAEVGARCCSTGMSGTVGTSARDSSWSAQDAGGPGSVPAAASGGDLDSSSPSTGGVLVSCRGRRNMPSKVRDPRCRGTHTHTQNSVAYTQDLAHQHFTPERLLRRQATWLCLRCGIVQIQARRQLLCLILQRLPAGAVPIRVLVVLVTFHQRCHARHGARA